MARTTPRLLQRVAAAAAASGLALAGLVLAATPASAAACSGASGVTVVVDTGSSTSTTCASGDPSSAMKALTGAGFSVVSPQAYPGSVVCRINGVPASDPCVRMPPADAYWAFFHAKRGGSWVYSSLGVASYDPAPGTVIGFRFGSGQQPRVAPPAPTATSRPRATAAPTKKSTPATRPTSATKATPWSASATPRGATPASTGSASTRPSASSSDSASAGAAPSAGATASGSAAATPTAGDDPTTVAAAPTSQPTDGSGTGTLLAGGALVALVAGGAGFAAWKRRG